eukprot:scaffold5966_cov121-Amphora_coffeaeformis.AAC.1
MPNLTTEEVNQLVTELLDKSFLVDGKHMLVRDAVPALAVKFKISTRQVYNIWKRALLKRNNEGTYQLSPAKKGKVGRDGLYDRELVAEAVSSLGVETRTTIRDVADGLGVSKSTTHRIAKEEGLIFSHTSALKPILREQNKVAWLLYAADRVEKNEHDSCLLYKSAYDEVHVDEKWFDLTPQSQRFYVTEKERDQGRLPIRKVQHKSHIKKVMFLAAVARP